MADISAAAPDICGRVSHTDRAISPVTRSDDHYVGHYLQHFPHVGTSAELER